MVSPNGRSVFRTNLHGLHAGFRFGPRLEHTVINDGRCGGRLFIDNGAFLGSRISHHIVLGRNSGLRKGRSDRKRDESARKQKFLHGSFLATRTNFPNSHLFPK